MVTRIDRFCEPHGGNTGWQEHQARKGNTTDRGYGWSWQKLRARILKRDLYLCRCEDCRSSGRVRPASEVDHIVAKAHGGTDDDSNLQAINSDCHKAKTARERMKKRGGGGLNSPGPIFS